jgi:serralysin
MRQIRTALALALTLACAQTPAFAAFHLWEVNEIFRSADGSLQYVELFNLSDFENAIAGHKVIASGGGPNREFAFPGNLATTSTANKTLLIATANFQALTGVTPDYTLPANFLNAGGGSVLFDGSGDSITYAAGAFTGANALGPGAVSQLPTPKNFAGQTGTIPVPEPGAGVLAAAAGIACLRRRRREKLDNAK